MVDTTKHSKEKKGATQGEGQEEEKRKKKRRTEEEGEKERKPKLFFNSCFVCFHFPTICLAYLEVFIKSR